MRISDWSSDVCSSDLWSYGLYDVAGFYSGDLHGLAELRQGVSSALAFGLTQKRLRNVLRHAQNPAVRAIDDRPGRARRNLYLSVFAGKIGRASCWVSMCQYV